MARGVLDRSSGAVDDAVMSTVTRARWLVVATVASIAMGVGINVVDAPGTMVWFQRQTGGLGTLDTQPLAGATVVHELLMRLGPAGRALYLQEILLFDIAFPIALLAMVQLALLRVWSSTTARRLSVLPWSACAIDLVENACAAVLTTTFPQESAVLADVVGVITAAKFATYAAGMIAVIVGLVMGRQRRVPGV